MSYIPKEIKIGDLTFAVDERGGHFFVTVRGIGTDGQRPLCGTLAMRREEIDVLHRESERAAAAQVNTSNMRSRVDAVELELEHWSPLRRVLRSWDWSSLLVDGALPEDAERQLIAAMVLVEQAFNSKKPEHVDDESRCAICGWPLAESVAQGCVRGNCSERPLRTILYAPDRAARERQEARRG